jgi:hypothetical protein
MKTPFVIVPEYLSANTPFFEAARWVKKGILDFRMQAIALLSKKIYILSAGS